MSTFEERRSRLLQQLANAASADERVVALWEPARLSDTLTADEHGFMSAGPVERTIRERVALGQRLLTHRGTEFGVPVIDNRGLILFADGETPERISWDCLESVVEFLSGKDWVPLVTRGHAPGLDHHLQGCAKAASVSWVATVLEHAGIAESRRNPGAEIRLLADSSA